ncbi:MAG TPA: hypothetical protein VIJ07_10005 [Dermatophilaceae bacterium]
MSPKDNWVDERVDVFLAALDELGMSASRAAATELIHERVRWVSSQTGISPAAARHYLTNDAVRDLARTMAFSFVDETPGADVIDAPRTAAVPLTLLARGIAGLAEAIQVRLCERDEVEHLRTTVAQMAHALSAVGQVLSDEPATVIDHVAVLKFPPGLINRVARYLEATAALVNDGVMPDGFDPSHAGQLAATFTEDAANLRATTG